MSAEISLSCDRIERYLGEEEERVHALRGVSLEIETGSVHAVVGPSGCGKSSLLYILGLLDTPDAGRVSIETETVSHLSDDELALRTLKSDTIVGLPSGVAARLDSEDTRWRVNGQRGVASLGGSLR